MSCTFSNNIHFNVTHRSLDELEEFVKKELTLIEQCLRANPKSYHSWFHRRWILQQGTKVDYAHELILCDKCLKLDDRNCEYKFSSPLIFGTMFTLCYPKVHCWDYRRFIVQMSDTPIESELDFSTERIKSNFSNYSSWHYRSELLPRIYPSKDSGTCIDLAKLSEGFYSFQRRNKYH
jgi:geranylgeranyl transferase type-2 subunit alpha